MNWKFKDCIFLMLFFHTHLIADAQSDSFQIRELKIGDKCPNFKFDKIVHNAKSSLTLDDFKGKLVILDFWATWCGPCVNALPKLDSLQKSFGPKIAIIPVSYEETNSVNKFIEQNPNLRTIRLPFITNDTTLTQFFRHRLIPHEVWIDGNGIVIAITDEEQVNVNNIQSFLQKKWKVLGTKSDLLVKDISLPIFAGGFGADYHIDPKKIRYYSVLTSNIEGTSNEMGIAYLRVGESVKIIEQNISISDLYASSFVVKSKWYQKENNPDFYLLMPSRTVLEISDSTLFNWPERNREEWLKIPDSNKLFCYEMYIPWSDSSNFGLFMLNDLNRNFGGLYGIEGLKEKRMTKCWALVRTTENDLIHSKGGRPVIEQSQNNDTLILHNSNIRSLMWNLIIFHMYRSPIPLIDETGYLDSIDLDIVADLYNLESVNNALEKYGLRFILVERNLEMIVIKDKVVKNKKL